jgi:hypothetical protein
MNKKLRIRTLSNIIKQAELDKKDQNILDEVHNANIIDPMARAELIFDKIIDSLTPDDIVGLDEEIKK